MTFDSTLVEVGIGLAFIFFVAASVVAALNEWVTRMLDIRAKVLWAALANAIDPNQGEAFTLPVPQLFGGFSGLFKLDKRPKVEQQSAKAPLSRRLANVDAITILGGKTTGGGQTKQGKAKDGGRTKVDHIAAATFSSALLQLAHRAGFAELRAQLARAHLALELARATSPDAVAVSNVLAGTASLPDELATAGLDAALASPFTTATAAWQAATGGDPAQLAAALATTAPLEAGHRELSAAIDGSTVRQLRELTKNSPLAGVIDAAILKTNGKIDDIIKDIETWFNDLMARLSELYRIAARKVLFGAGFVLAIAANINAIDLVSDLQTDNDARTALVSAASTCQDPTGDEANLDSCLKTVRDRFLTDLDAETSAKEKITLPFIGAYQSPIDALSKDSSEYHDYNNPLSVLLGWVVTGLAVSLGAPFWFDVARRLTTYRASRSSG